MKYRLLLRYSVLEEAKKRIESIDGPSQLTSKTIFRDKDGNIVKSNEDRYSYHLAVTDLFVEKAIAYLEVKADEYSSYGKILYLFALFVAIVGSGLSIYIYFTNTPDSHTNYLRDLVKIYQIYPANSNFEFVKSQIWNDMVSAFVRAFTMYGMIITSTVAFWRFGKAMLDQSERLFEQRHALRQGRLFVHLNDGKMSIEELERAFNWNKTTPNAFGAMPTDASGPWGNVMNEIAKIIPEIIRSSLNSKTGEKKT